MIRRDCLGIVIATGITFSNNEASGMVDECRILCGFTNK